MPRWSASGALTSEAFVGKGLPNSGKFDWAIPASTPAGSDYVIRVTRAGTPGIFSSSLSMRFCMGMERFQVCKKK